MVTGALTAGMWIAGAVLAWAGVGKVRRPHGTATALRLAGLPSAPALARALGAVEVVVGGAALVVGGPAAAAGVAVAYAALAAFSRRARRRPQASCGCFGDAGGPVTAGHVVLNVLFATVNLGAALTAAPGLAAATTGRPALLGAGIVLATTGAALVAAALTVVPELVRQVRPTGAAR